MTRIVFAAALALAAVLPAISAHAQAPRTFVSAAGSDSNPCSFAAPCRHFQTAVNATSAGGEVDALDPAGYGPIIISQAITIEGQGWSYIAPPPSGNGITINAVSGDVTIHGVSLNGAGITGGTNGIVFNSGDSLSVTDCLARNFTQNASSINTGSGILIQPTSGTVKFMITNTIVANNGNQGIEFFPPSGSSAINANGVIDHVVATGNANEGMNFSLTNVSSGSVIINISNSVASNNRLRGIDANNSSGPATFTVSIDSTNMSGNNEGVGIFGKVQGFLGRSVITGNNFGFENGTTPTNTFFTYKDNRFNNNTELSGQGTLNTTASLQ
jgi:hypothetical protein